MKNRVLITGATGNVGLSILKYLSIIKNELIVFAGVRNIEKDQEKLNDFDAQLIAFDFENKETFQPALKEIDTLFLLRPPQLADVETFFKPLIDQAKKNKVKHIIFLSVQGVENSKMIPHYKIEQLIKESEIDYTFLRPAYFMQNFMTTLHTDLVDKNRIYLPAGNAKFTLIDIDDIGKVTVNILSELDKYIHKSYELTNNEKLTFSEMAQKISKGLNKEIKYISPNLLQFYWTKRKENFPSIFIFVMIMLHYFPRFQKESPITNCVKNITKEEPQSFDDFIKRNRDFLEERKY